MNTYTIGENNNNPATASTTETLTCQFDALTTPVNVAEVSEKFWKNNFDQRGQYKLHEFTVSPFPKLPINSDDILSMARRSIVSSGPHRSNVRLFINRKEHYGVKNGAFLSPDNVEFFPFQDKDIFDYKKRMGNLVQGYYCLSIDGAFLTDELWVWANNLLNQYAKTVGAISTGNFITLFIGNFRQTPHSVHIDDESNFFFPIHGTKTIRTWPAGFCLKHPDIMYTYDYKQHLKESVALRAGPGGMMYWPCHDWHIGECHEDHTTLVLAVSMTDYLNDMLKAMNTMFYRHKLVQGRLLRLYCSLLFSALTSFSALVKAGRVKKKRNFHFSIARKVKRWAETGQLIDYLRKLLPSLLVNESKKLLDLRLKTGCGLRYRLHPDDYRSIQETDDIVIRFPHNPIAYEKFHGKNKIVYISANGCLFEYSSAFSMRDTKGEPLFSSSAPFIFDVINLINSGKSINACDLARERSQDDPGLFSCYKAMTLKLFNKLSKVGAIKPVSKRTY